MKTRRSARKLLLPLIALGMMTATMYWDASHRPHSTGAHAPAAARVAHDLHTR
jgi:hypothetical protein